MRTKLIISKLLNSEKPVSLEKLAALCQVSPRTIQNDLKYLSDISHYHGFQIENIRSLGYLITIKDKKELGLYLAKFERDDLVSLNPEERLLDLLFFLLNQDSYISAKVLVDFFKISNSTVRHDLKKIEKILSNFSLYLENKPYYGTKIIGAEHNKRKLLIELLYQEKEKSKISSLNHKISKLGNPYESYQVILSDSKTAGIHFNEDSLERLAIYINIGSYRRQTLANLPASEVVVTASSIVILAQSIISKLLVNAKAEVMRTESHWLAQEMMDLGFFESSDNSQKYQLKQQIKTALDEVDTKFKTHFCQDQELKISLEKHLLPLIQRLQADAQLDNPLIEDVYARYADAFSVSLFFLEVLNKTNQYQIAAEEVAYLSLYFAGSIEKQKSKNIAKFRKVLIVCTSGGGAAYLLKMKLESIFIGAEIDTTSLFNLKQMKTTSYDIIVSTTSIETNSLSVPVIQLTNFLDDLEEERLKELIKNKSLKHSYNSMNEFNFLDLFKSDCFNTQVSRDYLKLLKERSEHLIKKGYANQDYQENVLKRELSMTTIYSKGVAGPHPLELGALKECIDVTILQKPLNYQGKKVKLVFLINLAQGHLHLHKQISRFMMGLMADGATRKRVEEAKNFNEFIKIIKTIKTLF